MVTSANAGLRWLAKEAPDLDETRKAMKNVVSDGHRASEIIGSIRAMFKQDSQVEAAVDLNNVIQDVLRLVQGELKTQGILVQSGVTRPLPLVRGHSVQLQQVVMNLVRNAADAMDSVSGRPRVLRVETAVRGPDGVLLSVEDLGNGHRSRGPRPHLQVVLHDEIARHGNGIVDLSVDHRGPPWPALGFIRRRSWIGV